MEAEERLELPNSAYARFQSATSESPAVFSLQLSLSSMQDGADVFLHFARLVGLIILALIDRLAF